MYLFESTWIDADAVEMESRSSTLTAPNTTAPRTLGTDALTAEAGAASANAS